MLKMMFFWWIFAKIEIFKVFEKIGNGSKIWGNVDLKFEETNQPKVIFKVFEKSGNGSKIWGNGPKIWGNRSTNWDF